MGHGVSYPNYRQRLEVKAFAFVSGDKALPGLVSAAYCLHYSAGPPCFLQVNGHICFVSRYTSTAVSSSAAASSWTPLCAQRGAPGCLEGSEVMPRQALCPVAVPMVQHHAAHVSLLCAVAGSGMLGASSVVSLQGPVLLVPHGWAAARGEERCWCALAAGGEGSPSPWCFSAPFAGGTLLSKVVWAAVTATAVGVFSLMAIMLLFMDLLKCLKRRALMVNVVY